MEVWPYISSTSLLGSRRVRLGLGEASASCRSGELWPETPGSGWRCRGRCGDHGGRWGWGYGRLRHLAIGVFGRSRGHGCRRHGVGQPGLRECQLWCLGSYAYGQQWHDFGGRYDRRQVDQRRSGEMRCVLA